MPMTPDEREDAKLALEHERFAAENKREEAKLALDRQRLEIETKRLTLEENKNLADNRFLNRKFPVLVTAIVSGAAVFFSYVQFYIATEEKKREVDSARIKNEQEFKLAAAKFIADNSKVIFEGTDEERLRIRNVILVSFPPTVSDALFSQLEQSAPSAQAASTWSEGQKVAAAIAAKPEAGVSAEPRVYLHYQDKNDGELVDSLMSNLRANGYRVPGKQLVVQPTQGDIRYYHDEDKAAAEKIAKLVEQFLADSGRPLSLKRISLGKQYPNMPKDVFEVWLPKKT